MTAAKKARLRRFWFGVLGLILFLLLWVNQSVRSTQLSYRMQKVEQEIRQEQKRRTELELERDSLLSLENLEEVSKKKLGLVEPKDENIVIMSVKDSGK